MVFIYKLARRLTRLNVVVPIVALVPLACDSSDKLATDPEQPTANVVRIDLAPSHATVSIGETVEFSVVGLTGAGDTADVQVTWRAIRGTVSEGGDSRPGKRLGHYRSNRTGRDTVIASDSRGNADTATVDVSDVAVAAVSVSPASANVAAGATVQLSATLTDASGNELTGRQVAWSSSAPGVATVSPDGLVTGVSAGSATITATSEGQSGTAAITVTAPSSGGGGSSTTANLLVAFIGDQGDGSDALAVLRLIRDEGADMVLHQGDFDYGDSPATWDNNITSVLGANFPYFGSVGNHDDGDFYGSGGYQEKLQQRLGRISGATCTGDLGVNSACSYQGLFFILSGVGTLGSGHESYLRQQLEADHSTWRICSWHKNQNAMQVGGKGDEVGWGAYETCRELGAIIATAHEHSYSRTKTLVSTQNQTVDPAWSERLNLRVAEGATFVFVSGLGGRSIREQQRCLPATYPYGCEGAWASIYTSDQGATHGVLFIAFHVDGDPAKAQGYFRNINGQVVDQFTITSQPRP